MEGSKHLNSNGILTCSNSRPLTPTRVLRGIFCLLVLLSTAFMMLVYLGPVFAVTLRLFSVHYSRRATSFFFGTWLALWPFLFEKINGTKIVFSGETIPARERALLLANHRTEVDWMYLWDLALRKGCLGCIKYVLKSSLMRLPIFGWGFHILEFIAVERKWEVDESIMRQKLSTFSDPQDPLWLAIFPEGTDYTEEKCKRCQKYAAQNCLPTLTNVLLPKTKGFYACLEALRNSLDAVYDITIGYKYRCPSLMDNVFGVDPSEVHIHIRRIPLDQIPTTEDEAASWLMELFQFKDRLLTDFSAQGRFPEQVKADQDLSTLKCLVNIAIVTAITCLCIFLTFFSSSWFKVYICLSCAYLTWATYAQFQPSPIVSYVKSMSITSKKRKSKLR
ncbi:hypothetical protein Sjap_010448 [Stephania japonica]|uniref:1-acylglycerol-3-phosphate O-acyltransferase n=1 Tax=Stephania japonica TaxID=461633 RepID=A0AAP0JBG1_9MAGN